MTIRRFALLACVLLGAMATSPGSVDAAARSRGNFFVYDSSNCTGNGNAAVVTVPFSVGGRNYPPNIEMTAYATDMNTGERVGPFVVTTNSSGAFCEQVVRARATRWKIDLVEPGNGSTDSKVVRVNPSPPPTTVPTTTSPVTTTPATTVPVTTSPGTTTTAPGGTSTTAPSVTTTTSLSTTTTVDSEAPIELVPIDPPDSWTLPGTGSATGMPAAVALVLVGCGLIATLAARRRA